MGWRRVGRACATAVCGWVFLGGLAQAQVAGHTPGEFSVDGTGAATYQVPLKVPPGAAGMQPELALLYHSRAGNGQLGVGWSLSGLSAITRCPAFLDQEGVTHTGGVTLSVSDRFCLDGQPLRHQSGTYGATGIEYFTEVQSFQKVTSHGSIGGAPTHFSVTGKDGLTRYYGNTTDSRILSAGVTSGVPIVWALNRIQDKLGNFISFSYGFDAALGEYWPSDIRWSNNASVVLGRVVFNYSTTRDDKTFGHAYGRNKQSLTRRLESIQVYEGLSSAVRRYVLSYLTSTNGTGVTGSPLSYLYTLKECAGTGTPCLAPTQFLRDVGTRGVSSISPPTIAGDFAGIKWLDVNGDGRMDGVAQSSGSLRIYLAKNNGSYTTATLGSNLSLQNAVVLDYNGDSLTDLLIPNTSSGYWTVFLSTGTSLVAQTTTHAHYNAHNNGKQPVAFDLTGNGIPELFFYNNGKLWFYRGADSGGFVAGAIATGYTVTAGQRFHPLQFNGDGRPDMLISMDDCAPYVPPPDCEPYINCEINIAPPDPGNGTTAEPSPTGTSLSLEPEPYPGDGATIDALSTGHCSETAGVYRWDPTVAENGGLTGPYHQEASGLKKLRLLDMDGDGLTDVVGLNASGAVSVYLNRGGTYEAQSPSISAGPNWDKAIVFDYNLDDRDDVLIHQSSGTFQLLTFVNNALATASTSISSQNNNYVVADHNGDGLPDFLVFTGSQWRLWPHQGRKQGLLVRIQDGLGDELNIKYAALSRADPAYTLYEGHLPSDAATTTPRVRNFLGPIFVVENFAADTGINTSAGVPEKIVT